MKCWLTIIILFVNSHVMALDPAQTFKTLCMACHTEQTDAGLGNRVAPPPFALKLHYIEHFKEKDIFVKAIAKFLQNPSKNDSMMPSAVEKFGLMNKISFEAKDFEALATYIYETEFKTPEWYLHHRKSECKANKLACEQIAKTAAKIRKSLEIK